MKIIEKIKKNQSPITFVTFGDSVTQGCFECYVDEKGDVQPVYDEECAYGNRLYEMLRLLYPTASIRYVNAGISGNSAQNGVRRIDKDVLAEKPDLVIVGFALNDSTKGVEGLNAYKKSMSEILGKIRAFGAECIVLTPNAMNTTISPDLKEEPLRKFAAAFMAVQNEGILDLYAQAARDLATEYGAVLCDVYAKWQEMIAAGADVTSLLANRLNHPLRKMHYFTAMMLCDCLLK